MYSKDELKSLKQNFWSSFADYCNTIPQLAKRKEKFMLYNTRLKGTELKFSIDRNNIAVILEINHNNPERRNRLFSHFLSCNKIIQEHFPDRTNIHYEQFFKLPEGKEVARIYVQRSGLDFHNQNRWNEIHCFMAQNMIALEQAFKLIRSALPEE